MGYFFSSASQPGLPPKPPSRTRSSYDSVSKRLSHGFELAQMMRQHSIDNGKCRFPFSDISQKLYTLYESSESVKFVVIDFTWKIKD